jgi:predicted ABC-type sugar transport system permease subunit
MIHDLFAWLLATFVIGPVQAELATKMQAVKAPAAIMQQVQDCVVNGTPALIARAVEDPFWGITTTISVVAGLTDAEAVLAGTSPQCATAIGAVKPLLDMPEA